MTAQTNSNAARVNQQEKDKDNVIVWEKHVASAEGQDRRPDAGGAKRRPPVTLRQRLLMTIVPIAVTPLLVASAIGFNQTRAQVEGETLLQLEEDSLLASGASHLFLKDVLQVPSTLASNPLVIEVIQEINQKVAAEGIADLANQEIESQYIETKLIAPNAKLNSYLKSVAKNVDLAGVIVTDRHGFNVGFSQLTPNIVQRDKRWWKKAKINGTYISEPEFSAVHNRNIITVAKPISDNSGNMIGLIKADLFAQDLNAAVSSLVSANLSGSETVEIVDPRLGSNHVVNFISDTPNSSISQPLSGGVEVLAVAKTLVGYQESDGGDLALTQAKVQHLPGIQDFNLVEKEVGEFRHVLASFTHGERFYQLAIIPDTELIAIASVATADSAALAKAQLRLFGLTALLLASVVVLLIYWLSNSVTTPLTNLTRVAEQATGGKLDAKATVVGTRETQTLARTFNSLVAEVKTLLGKEAAVAKEQQDARDQLEHDIYQLIDEVSAAVYGDLTVRASLTSMEMSTVADLVNAIIDSLSSIASQVQASSVQVRDALADNGERIEALAAEALQEKERTRQTLDSVEQMATSIDDVAATAGEAAAISDAAYETVQEGSLAMEQTVESILSLRSTVGETAKKIKRLGESSQQISQVVSLIEEIALKTNLLAINASVEASRAGERGQGFTVVAEQVGALAEQSAAATKEIAQIVAGIQMETQDVTAAMEVGTNQVVDTTRMVESTKDKLTQVQQRTQDINQLMRSISDETVSQSETSKLVTTLMQQLAELADLRSQSSTEVADSMQATATIARTLETAAAHFRVPDGDEFS